MTIILDADQDRDVGGIFNAALGCSSVQMVSLGIHEAS